MIKQTYSVYVQTAEGTKKWHLSSSCFAPRGDRRISRSTPRCILDARNARSTVDRRRYPRSTLARRAPWYISLRAHQPDAGDRLALDKKFVSRGQHRFVALFPSSVPAVSIAASCRRTAQIFIFAPLSVVSNLQPIHDWVALHVRSRSRSFFGPPRGARGVSSVPTGPD